MIDPSAHSLRGETLITLAEAAKDFGGIAIPIATVRTYVYQGIKGLKLESVSINGRYTSKEAIERFIAKKQNRDQPFVKPPAKRLTPAEVAAGLKRYGVVR
jgi:hypothetical protein